MAKPSTYDRDQHKLICDALGVSPDPKAPGSTAYEAVCVLLWKLDEAEHAISRAAKGLLDSREAKESLKFIKAHHDSDTFAIVPIICTPNAPLKTIKP